MTKIHTDLIKESVYNLCILANTQYDSDLYDIVLKRYDEEKDEKQKTKLANIINNINIAYKTKRPLCQDTGQVIVFVNIGQNIMFEGQDITTSINKGIEEAYTKNFYRKSVVKNAITDRTNTSTNTPAIIYTEFNDTDYVELQLLIKGAGSENYSSVKMFNPTDGDDKIFTYIDEQLTLAGEKSCPPYVLGIGCGGTMDYAAFLSKKAFFKKKYTKEEKLFIENLKSYISAKDVLKINLITDFTHIACKPLALTINCHSTRHSSCIIKNSKILYNPNNIAFREIKQEENSYKKVSASDINALKSLKIGDCILLSGEIYTARDAAHKKLKEYYEKHGKFPIGIENKIIFYAGPCPATKNEIIGPTGPTTSSRMDEYCELMYNNGLIATIGKGERSDKATKVIKANNARYFTAQGGIACVLQKCITDSQVICFEELGTEAIRKLTIKNMPLEVNV